MVACLNREDDVYPAVEMGELEIDLQGRIWRVAVRRSNRRNPEAPIVMPCERRRAEKQFGDYLQVRVMFNWTRYHALAHRLVWRHFNGPIPPGLTVNHKNGNKAENWPENLELATSREQILHALHVLKRGRVDQWGTRNAMVKLSTSQVEEIRARRANGERLLAIAADYGVAYQQVSKIARGDRRSRG